LSVRDITSYNRPLLNFSRKTSERLVFVSICAGLAIAQSAYMDGGTTLFVALASVAGALITELCVNFLRKKPGIHDASAVTSALVLTLLLPNTIAPWIAAVAAVFAIAVVKESFGGFGSNWLNPALGGWLFARFSWPVFFQDALKSSPLTFLSNIEGGDGELNPIMILTRNDFGVRSGEGITQFLNRNVFSLFDIELPANYIDFFLDPGTGIIADRGIFGLLVGCALLIASRAVRWKTSIIFMALYLFLAMTAGANISGGGDMIFCLFSGGTLVVAFILACEPVSGPKSNGGRVFYALAIALLAFVFRYIKVESYGAIFACAFLNMVTPIVCMIEEKIIYEKNVTKSDGIAVSSIGKAIGNSIENKLGGMLNDS
jgi:electron transport complex protein RnfD